MKPSQASAEGSGRIRVLIVTDEMEVGGTQRQIVHIARSLDPARFEPTVAYFRTRSFLVDELHAVGVPVVEVPKRGRIDPAFVRRLAAFVRDGGFDVMHCFAFTGELWGAVARRLVPRARRPALITSVRNKYDWYTGMQWRLKAWSARQSCRVVANSQAGGEYARTKMALAPGAVDIVYNGVADLSGNARALPASAGGSPVTALFVGRLVEQKNLPVLLRAMRRLRASGLPLKLRIVGDGPLRASVRDAIAEFALQADVEMLGERSDTTALMAAADFVVLPSSREGLSNVILEAMMAGRPVVASAVGGNVELVVPHETGLLFASDDDAQLADAMRSLVAEATLRDRMGTLGRKRAIEHFSVAAMVGSMQDFYSQCAQIRRAALADH